ncbi:MAG: hypothetical protein ACRDKJ_03105 [Actinomycetota bacterium]
MLTRRGFVAAAVGLLLASILSGHLLLRVSSEVGHHDEFQRLEANAHGTSVGSVLLPQGVIALGLAGLCLVLYARSRRRWPAALLIPLPLGTAFAQEYLEHGGTLLGSLPRSASFAFVAGLSVLVGVLLIPLARRVLHAIADVVRRVGAARPTRLQIIATAQPRRIESVDGPARRLVWLVSSRTAPRGPPVRRSRLPTV